MLFGSLQFVFVFLPLSLLLYHGLRISGRPLAAKAAMVAVSLFFYGWWDGRYLLLLLGSVFANYALGLALHHARAPGRRAVLLHLGLAANLLLLGWFKYANFAVENLGALLGVTGPVAALIVPLAISFFTFQQVAYLVEIWRGDGPAESLLDYTLFVTFFPHLVAGPITHHREMLPQFAEAGRAAIPAHVVATGLAILVLGMAKKVLLADVLGTYADPVFGAAAAGNALGTADAWLGTLAYTLQLYFDFSGYSDMAIGIGLLFGIRFPVNFDSPYKSLSITDFWRRWHMSLSMFLRNYLYIPLGGSRHGEVRRNVNLMATMLIGGLWHGAGWTFVFWGFLHGLFLVVNHAWRARAAGWSMPVPVAWALTMLCVVVAWVFFRATSFEAALAMLRAMVAGSAASTAPGLPETTLGWGLIVVAMAIAVGMPNVLRLTRYPEGLITEEAGAPVGRLAKYPVLVSVCLGLVAAACIARLPEPGIFLYFNF